MKTLEQKALNVAVQGYYDVQKQRIAHGQRIVQQFLTKLNLPPEPKPLSEEATREEKIEYAKQRKDRDDKINEFCVRIGIEPSVDTSSKKPKITDFLEEVILKDYKNITDFMITNGVSINKALAQSSLGIISTVAEKCIVDAYLQLVKAEDNCIVPIKEMVEDHPLWTNFLQHVKGVGPMMAGVMLSEFDINVPYPMSFITYAGLDTVTFFDEREEIEFEDTGVMIPNENFGTILKVEGRSRKVSHRVLKEYVDKKGETKEKLSITFNPFVKTKLVGVMAPGFLKAVDRLDEIDQNTGKKITKPNYYAQIYYSYRARLDNMDEHNSKSKAHKNRMGLRYMTKMFLIDLWLAWRMIEGLPLATPYHEGKLGMERHATTHPALNELFKKFAPELVRSM